MHTWEAIKRVASSVLDFLFPKKCVLCGEYGAILCVTCAARVPSGPLFFCPVCTDLVPSFGWCRRHQGYGFISGAVALGSYDDKRLKALVHALKYEGAKELGDILGRKLGEVVRCRLIDCTAPFSNFSAPFCIVPAPLHRHRLIERDYNQAELIAKGVVETVVGRATLMPILRRQRYTTPQAQLSGEARRKNIVGSFAATGSIDRNALYILVDDVSTTGATLAACAQALSLAGAQTICALVVARG